MQKWHELTVNHQKSTSAPRYTARAGSDTVEDLRKKLLQDSSQRAPNNMRSGGLAIMVRIHTSPTAPAMVLSSISGRTARAANGVGKNCSPQALRPEA